MRRPYDREPHGRHHVRRVSVERLQMQHGVWKVPPWQCLSSALAHSSGCAWWLWAARHSQGEVRPLAAQPPPRVLEPAASKVSDSTRAFDHLGKTNTVEYPCCADTPYTALVVTLELKRSNFFYALVIIVPGILFTLMCCAHHSRIEPQHTRSHPRVHIVRAPLHGSSQSWRSSLTPPTSARGWASAVRCC
jgi:hypothetical protein